MSKAHSHLLKHAVGEWKLPRLNPADESKVWILIQFHPPPHKEVTPSLFNAYMCIQDLFIGGLFTFKKKL